MNTRSNRFLMLVVVLQAVLVVGQWLSGFVSVAQAQVPDAGGQRVQMIQELKSVNANLDRLTALLESGKLQVRTTAPAEQK